MRQHLFESGALAHNRPDEFRKNDGWLRPQRSVGRKSRADGRGPERLYEQDFSASHTSKEGASMTRRTPLQASAAAGIVLIVLLDDVFSYRFLLPLEGIEHYFRAGKDHLHILA
ncbi:hypothetical protein GOB48_28220 [Sinorhizobium meliloti]|nr:hypothetical protein [Sinorhizobium meliloti]